MVEIQLEKNNGQILAGEKQWLNSSWRKIMVEIKVAENDGQMPGGEK